MENNKDLIDRIEALEEKIERIDRRTRSQGRDLDLNSLATIAFIGMTLIVLVSIRINYGAIQYGVDLKEWTNLLSIPAIASFAAAAAAWMMKNQGKDDQ